MLRVQRGYHKAIIGKDLRRILVCWFDAVINKFSEAIFDNKCFGFLLQSAIIFVGWFSDILKLFSVHR